MTIRAFTMDHPALAFFILTFAISWGCIIMVMGPAGVLGTKEVAEELLPLVYLATLLGPSVAGLLMTGLVDGRAGFRDLLARLRRGRTGVRWYAVALLTAPLLILAILLLLSLQSPAFLPVLFSADDKAGLLLTGIVMGLVVGFFEELGWTGFVVPRLRQRYGVLATGLIVGLLWGAWHLPLFLASASLSGALPPVLYLSVLLFSFLPAYRVLMVWVYDRTRSLLLVVLMHAPLAGSQLVLIPPSLSGTQVVIYDLLFAAALWTFVALVAAANRGLLDRRFD